MTLVQKFSGLCCAVAALTAVLALAGAVVSPVPQKGAILAAVLGGVFAAGCLAVGAQWIFGRALREVERRLARSGRGQV